MESEDLKLAPGYDKVLNRMMRLLISRFKPLQLFYFAKNSLIREQWGCFAKSLEEPDAHYYLLMITDGDQPNDGLVQKFINARFVAGKISILCFSNLVVEQALKNQSRFFHMIYEKAYLRYSQTGYNPVVTIQHFRPANIYRKALRNTTYYMSFIDGYFSGAQFNFHQQDYPAGVFMLHKAAEQCLQLLLYVYLSFPVSKHTLPAMINLTKLFSRQPQQLLMANEEDKYLLNILCRNEAIVLSSPKSFIPEELAKKLYIRISTFIKMTKVMCALKIEQLHADVVNTPAECRIQDH